MFRVILWNYGSEHTFAYSMKFFLVWHIESFVFCFKNKYRYRAMFHAYLFENVFLPNSRIFLVVEAYFCTLMIEETAACDLLVSFEEHRLPDI